MSAANKAHTELPWTYAHDVRPRPEIATVCRVGSYVVGVSTPGYPGGDYLNIDCPDPEGESDAAFICLAVNAHSHLVDALKDLIRAYVNNLENARDRIVFLGGDCDPVDVMERGDPYLAKARLTLSHLTTRSNT